MLHRQTSIRILLPILVLGIVAGSCKQSITGPQTESTDSLSGPHLLISPHIGYVNKDILFTATPVNLDTGSKIFVWNFPGHTYTLQNQNIVSYRFPKAGDYFYTVSVYAKAESPSTLLLRDTETITILSFSSSIAPATLEAVPNASYKFQVKPDSGIVGTNYTYVWMIGDSGTPAALSHQDTARLSFPLFGAYTVTVRILDSALNLLSSATSNVIVSASLEGLTITPRLTTVDSQVKVTVRHPPLEHNDAFSVDWDFGDGIRATGARNSDTISHTYSKAGKYIISGRMYDPASNASMFVVADTVFVASIPTSSVTISPKVATGRPGERFQFAIHYPTLDSRHTYHIAWSSNGDPAKAIRVVGNDTFSVTFGTSGSKQVKADLYDEQLGVAIGVATANVEIGIDPSGVSMALIKRFHGVTIEFKADNTYDNNSSYIRPPGNDWVFKGSDASNSVAEHLHGDTIEYVNSISNNWDTSGFGFSQSQGSGRSEVVSVLLSPEGTTCLFATGTLSTEDNSSSEYQGVSNGRWAYSNNKFTAVSLPLLSYSSDHVTYGVLGSAAEFFATVVSYSNSATWLHGPAQSSCDYLNSSWASGRVIPSITVTFHN